MKKILFLGAAWLALAGCTTSLSANGEKIRVTHNPDAVKGCKYLETIHERSFVGGVLADGSMNALNKIKNKAAEIGGDIVFVVSETGGWNPATITAEVYKCQ